jgi:hypothetical protein
MSNQNGWIRKRHRKSGDIWVYCYRRRRWDGKWVQTTERRLGTVTEIPSEEVAWERVNELGLKRYTPDAPRNPRISFGEVAAHYIKFELPDDQSNVTIEKSQSTITKYKHYLNRWVFRNGRGNVLSACIRSKWKPGLDKLSENTVLKPAPWLKFERS